MTPLFIGTIGLPELAVIAGIMVLLFGGKKIAQLERGTGKAISNFKKGLKSGGDKDEDAW